MSYNHHMDQNIAHRYYQDEQDRTRRPRPVLYWGILAVVAMIAMIIILSFAP